MELSEAIRPQCLQAQLACSDKSEALMKVAQLAKKSPILDSIPLEQLHQGLIQREQLCSTGVGEGIAIPHCRVKGIDQFVAGMLTLAKPIPFDAIDGKPVSIIAFIVGPESNTADHARILSGLSLQLSAKDQRKQIQAAETDADLIEAVVVPKAAHRQILTGPEKRLVHVVIQNEDSFHTVLQAIESIEQSTAVVIESNNATQYLTRLPVFASLLSDGPNQFSRVILATVNHAMTNELLRRIEAVTGPLAQRTDVSVIVQDVFLVAGSLAV